MRPKVHYFIKGLEGAVMTFVRKPGHEDDFRAELYLSRLHAMQREAVEPAACPPLLVCKNCGQHYLEGYYRNLADGGWQVLRRRSGRREYLWEVADETNGGDRVIFTNRFSIRDRRRRRAGTTRLR